MKRKEGHIEYRLLMAATLPVFFFSTILKRLMPWNWGRDSRSLFAATRAAAHNTIPFVFM